MQIILQKTLFLAHCTALFAPRQPLCLQFIPKKPLFLAHSPALFAPRQTFVWR